MGNLTAKTSGEIASFMTPAKTNIKSLKVHFSPKQLGTGDPSPENVREIVGWDGVKVNGNGKNLFDKNNMTRRDWYYYADGLSESPSAISGYFLEYIHVKPNTTYYISGTIRNAIYLYTFDKTWIKKYSAFTGGRKFTTTNDCFYIRIQYGLSTELDIDTIQLEEAFTSTPYELYQGTSLSYQWKLPDEYQEVEYIESTGTQYIKTNYIPQNFDSIKCLFSLSEFYESSTYWTLFSAGTGTYQLILLLAKTSGGVDGAYYKYFASGTASKFNFSPNIDTKYEININSNGIISCNDYTAQSNYQNAVNTPLYLMRRANNASPFKGKIYNFNIINNGINMINLVPCYRKSDNEIGMYDTISQTFYTNQGTGEFLKGEDVNKTFYGGYVDLISGELAEEWGTFTVDEPDSTWRVAAYNRITINFPRKYIFGSRLLKDKSMCTILPENHTDWNYGYIDNVASVTNPHALSLNYTGNGGGWSELFGEEATNENVKEHLQEIGFAICATLAEPITHQFTPTQLQSFVGQNNFWSNADYVEVEYDLIETEDIQKCRKKIMLNQPHTESIIDDIANFTTNMKAPLKECKVYFNPIQEGSGDPSPDNVRNIIGWDEVNVYQSGNIIIPNNTPNRENNGITWTTNTDGSIHVEGTLTSKYSFYSGSSALRYYIKGNTTYKISGGSKNIGLYLSGINLDGTTWSEAKHGGMDFGTGKIFTLDQDAFVKWQAAAVAENITINETIYPKLTIIDTNNFEPYQGTTVSTSWSDNVGTVYGGYVDLAKGEVVAEWIERTINSFDWSYNSSGECFRASANIKRKNVNAISPIQSKIYKTTKVYNSISYWLNVDDFSISEHTGISSQSELINSIHIKDSRYTTVSDFLNGVGNESIIYELAEPIHYSLTPQQLLTFKGENNIWSDTNGQTEVKFWTH